MRHAVGVDAGHARARATPSTPRRSSCACAFSRKLGRIGRQHALAALDQHHARVVRIDAAEFAAQGVARDLGEGAGELDAGRRRRR